MSIRRDDRWREIEEFPGYFVSIDGELYGEKTNTYLQIGENNTGTLKVNLMRDGRICTRAVKQLVAQTWIPNDDPELDTPININGDLNDNRVPNLSWRPRWFAWKYTRQFHESIPQEYNIEVFNEQTHVLYPSVMEAGIADGVLWEYVYNSMLTGRRVYPTGASYRFNFKFR